MWKNIMPMQSITFEKLKRIELELLSKVDEICKKLEIDYFLMGGTLLGAVRHNGFIPWDDDIDIIMRRQDYDKFLKEAPKMLPSYYFLQTGSTDKEYLLYYAKLRDSRTTFWETANKHQNINHGVFIDIFPFDYYPDGKWRCLFKKIKMLIDIRIFSWHNNEQKSCGLKNRILKLIGIVLLPTPHIAKKVRDWYYQSVTSSKLVANMAGAWGEKEVFGAEYFDETIKVQFEGKSYCIPAKYDLILSQMYGDYMKLPPIEKRIAHHYTEVIDLENSYKEYADMYISH